MTDSAATLINLLVFITGASLYAMLLVMVFRATYVTYVLGAKSGKIPAPINRLLLITTLLGLCWNVGAFAIYILDKFGISSVSPLLVSLIFTALGFLPAVVVHSVLRAGESWHKHRSAFILTVLAYLLSAIAGFMHFYVSFHGEAVPSHIGLHVLTAGFGSLIIVLLFLTHGQPNWRRALWVVALAVFAVTALHLSHHDEGNYPWWIELAGHHASLPLAVAILYQDYRFAFVDIFLKRALALIVLVGVIFSLYVCVLSPLLAIRDTNGNIDLRAVGVLLAIWTITALCYPLMKRSVSWFVDKVLLHRVNYEELRSEIARNISLQESVDSILKEVCQQLRSALVTSKIEWLRSDEIKNSALVSLHTQLLSIIDQPEISYSTFSIDNDKNTHWLHSQGIAALVVIPTHDAPQYLIIIGELVGGRRLLSDDIAMLEAVALLTARRIDAVRVTHDRCAMDLREQEISKLATEAELRALRAQLNPHFLFNALTTIGYLIQTNAGHALETLMQLTGLLRGVLRRSTNEFTTVGDELDIIKAYLDIEKARFEERLNVRVEIPTSLHTTKIPTLLIQPLVENAIKHGIAPSKAGGEVFVKAQIVLAQKYPERAGEELIISVRDTGIGASESTLAQGRQRGLGLANIERRLKCHYGDEADLNISSGVGVGTVVEITLPVRASNAVINEDSIDNRSEVKQVWM
ncbi:MAG: histidine kinase [Acidobacteriota bacterium]